jgi:hypothetical protein
LPAFAASTFMEPLWDLSWPNKTIHWSDVMERPFNESKDFAMYMLAKKQKRSISLR